ncbi:MAG: hypothetical protein RI958_2736 [Actinomycetota bacterium]|jgi:nucleotide-binding universal stress UspA family protein
MPNRSIIVGVDGSATSARAARTAATLARALDCTLHVVRAHGHHDAEVVGVGNDRWVVSEDEEITDLMKPLVDELRAIHPSVTVSAPEGRPHDVLIAEAARLNAQLIVVGNRHMQGVGRVLGSVANYVAHHAPCDVYIAHTT